MFGIDWATTGGIMTVLAMLLFIGVAVWAWSPARKQRFDEAAQIPLQDEQEAQPNAQHGKSVEHTEQERKS